MKPYITVEAVRELNEFNVALLRDQIANYRREAQFADTPIERAELLGAADALQRAAALLNLEDIQLQTAVDGHAGTGLRVITRLPTPQPQGVTA